MKQLIGLVHLGALTALYVALCGARRQTQATETIHNRYPKKPDRQAEPEGELVLLGLDGTVIAREVNLAPHALLTNSAADLFSASGRD
jgi:hypothetical protein